MKKHLAAVTICTLALTNAIPAVPVYAAAGKPAAAYSARQRREGQKKVKDAASRVKSAFKKQDLNGLRSKTSRSCCPGFRSCFDGWNEVRHCIHGCLQAERGRGCRGADGRRCRSESV